MGLSELDIRDLRGTLPRAAWSIGTRPGTPTSITIHYNGPPVRDRSHRGEINQLIFDARFQMRPGALGAASGGDGLQYHYAVLSDGTIYQTRDLSAILWHCGHAHGNTWSLAIHLPLGGQQDATAPQWAATERLMDGLIDEFAMAGRRQARGHQEWSDTACPGRLMPRVRLFRDNQLFDPPKRFLIVFDEANVRQGPGLGFPIAAVMQPGEVLEANALVLGENIGGETRWAHRVDGLGFVHMSLLRLIKSRVLLDRSRQSLVLGGGNDSSDTEEPDVLGGFNTDGISLPEIAQPTTKDLPLRFTVLLDDTGLYREPSLDDEPLEALQAGTPIEVTTIVLGQQLGGEARWIQPLHMSGYIHLSMLKPVTAT